MYSKGSEYLAGLKLVPILRVTRILLTLAPSFSLTEHIDGWRNICITLIFVLSSYGLVFILMKLRSKKSKSAN